jgi:hypothetical protein
MTGTFVYRFRRWARVEPNELVPVLTLECAMCPVRASGPPRVLADDGWHATTDREDAREALCPSCAEAAA